MSGKLPLSNTNRQWIITKSAGKHNELYYSYYTLATCYTTLNDYKKAEEYTLKCIELSPNAKAKASAHLNLLRIYMRTKDFAKADEVIRALKHYKESDILQTGALQNYYISWLHTSYKPKNMMMP